MEFSRTQLTILIPSMLLCGIVSVFFGKELCWDLANYHFYNPYALLYGRQSMDYWPASNIHQYINPAIDLLTFFLIQTFTPRISEFILGAISGVNFWLLFLIASEFLSNDSSGRQALTRSGQILAFVFALMGLCGPTTLPGIGSFQNDNLICIFVLGFVLLQLQGRLFFAGLVLGLGFGLKLTAGIYIAGGVMAALLMPGTFKVKCKFIVIMGMGIFIGMMITGGYWMLIMWQEHHNPLFPFLNFSSGGWRDTRFLPKNVLETIFYPFYFSFDGRIADAPFRDFRFCVVYVLFVLAALCRGAPVVPSSQARKPSPYGGRCPRGGRGNKTQSFYIPPSAFGTFPRRGKASLPGCAGRQLLFLFAFFIFSYLLWQHFFSIARYLAPLEMLAPLIIYLLLRQLINNISLRLTLVFSIFAGILLTLSPIPMIRAAWYDNTFFNVKMPASIAHTSHATVLVAYSAYVLNVNPRPQSYLIPFFPSAWHFIGIPLLNEKNMLEPDTQKIIAAKLPQNTDAVFLLASERNMPELFKAVEVFGLAQNGKCEKITSDRQAVTHQNVLLCPARKI